MKWQARKDIKTPSNPRRGFSSSIRTKNLFVYIDILTISRLKTFLRNPSSTMKSSVATMMLALSSSVIAAPFSLNGTEVYPTSSARPTPSTTGLSTPYAGPSSVPPGPLLASPVATSSTSRPTGSGSETASFLPKRSGLPSIPTDLPSLISDAESALGALASAGARKRDGSLSIPTDLPSLVSYFESAGAALASGGAQKRDEPLSPPTDLPSLISDVEPVAAAVASRGAQKHKHADSATLPTDLPSLISDAEFAIPALASAGARKRDASLSLPTDLPSLVSNAESIAAALASSGAQKRDFTSKSRPTPTVSASVFPSDAPSGIPSPTPTGSGLALPSSTSSRPAGSSSPTDISILGFPIA
jgi:hypothetical protein